MTLDRDYQPEMTPSYNDVTTVTSSMKIYLIDKIYSFFTTTAVASVLKGNDVSPEVTSQEQTTALKMTSSQQTTSTEVTTSSLRNKQTTESITKEGASGDGVTSFDETLAQVVEDSVKTEEKSTTTAKTTTASVSLHFQ